jgi:hypothetical protein
MSQDFIEKHHRLFDPVASFGDQLYIICTQNGLFPDSWVTDHSPHEMEDVWAHPIKLLDGYWFAIRRLAGPGPSTLWTHATSPALGRANGRDIQRAHAGSDQ